MIQLIQGSVPSPRLQQLVRTCGVAFELTLDSAQRLRQAGAQEPVIEAVRRASEVRATAAAELQLRAELALWDSIKDSRSSEVFADYLRQYPDGRFSTVARNRLTELRAEAEREQQAAVVLKLGGAPMEFVRIPAGGFEMGSGSLDANLDERPLHKVQITRAFEIGRTEVTQAQWQAVMGSNPSLFKGADRPVERVSWNSAQEFLKRMNASGDGYRYRLPTEAEWEYAARAGRNGDRYGDVDGIAWYSGNSKGQTHPVAQKQPNGWGLHDMLGNVWEWCQDRYGPYSLGALSDPQGLSYGQRRVLRGGSWGSPERGLRLPFRFRDSPDAGDAATGLRCVREKLP